MAHLQPKKIIPDFGKSGKKLLPVVLQNVASGEVLFVAFTNRQAFNLSLERGEVYLWSRGRRELWHKGATSGDFLKLMEVRINCNQDSLLYLIKPLGKGVCHNQNEDGISYPTCYYRTIAYRYVSMIKESQKMKKEILTIGMPNGSLDEITRKLFAVAGLKVKLNGRDGEAVLEGTRFINRVIILRPQDIPLALEKGVVDWGLCGFDYLVEYNPAYFDLALREGLPIKIIAELPYAKQGAGLTKVVLFSLPGKEPPDENSTAIFCSEYPRATKLFFPRAEIEFSHGTTEAKIKAGLYDYGVCLTETGRTIKDNGLSIIKTLFVSPVVLLAREKSSAVLALGEILLGALRAQEMQLLKMNAGNALIPAIINVLPSLHCPTINPLADGWSAIEAVVPKDGLVDLYLELRSIGASGIIWHDLNVVVP